MRHLRRKPFYLQNRDCYENGSSVCTSCPCCLFLMETISGRFVRADVGQIAANHLTHNLLLVYSSRRTEGWISRKSVPPADRLSLRRGAALQETPAGSPTLKNIMPWHPERLSCFTFNVLVRWNLDVSFGKFSYFLLSLLDTILISQPAASFQPVVVNTEFCFNQVTFLFLITAKQIFLLK